MKPITSLLILCGFVLSFHSFGQSPTFGLLKSDIGATEGYTLFTPQYNSDVYLIDNCGEVINKWTFSENPGLSCYLLENGNLLRAGQDSLEIRDWDNTLVWSYAMTDNGYLQHHDIEPLPNGNIFCVLSDRYSDTVAIEQGRNPANLGATIKLEKIIELQPVGSNDAALVWEWKFLDHLIQDFDNTKANFGVVADSPELFDFNYATISNLDNIHLNAVDYNAELDQIIISAKHTHELYIIDHSTSLLEAASHAGGNSNRGGDFLWRWGNPQVYQQGLASDQTLFDQHDPKWIPSAFPDSGKISVFNNGGDGTNTFSAMTIIAPEFVGTAYTMDPNKFLPLTAEWSWNGAIFGDVVFENKKCGMQVLSSGNVLFCESEIGRISEINRSGDHLWSYRNPTYNGGAIYNQFDVITTTANTMFRGERYEPTYPGLVGEDLTPQGLIENQNPLQLACILGVNELDYKNELIVVNPASNGLLNFNKSLNNASVVLIDMLGRIIYSENDLNGNIINLNVEHGAYLLRVAQQGKASQQKILIR